MPSITRRAFLPATATAAALAAKRSPRPARVIDTHTHFYDPSRPQGVPWPGKGESKLYRTVLPAEFVKTAGPFGIVGTVVVEASPWLEDNQWVLDMAKDNPSIVGLVGHLNPGSPEFARHVARFSKNPLFRGIRTGSDLIFKPRNPQLLVDDLKRMADADWVIDLNGNSSQYVDILKVADRVPQLRIVVEHLPYDPPEQASARPSAAAALRELAHRPQVWGKISNVLRHVDDKVPDNLAFYRSALEELWSAFGPDKIVYGSNWPVSDNYAPYPTVFRIVAEFFGEKGQATVDKYFYENSRAAYKWIKRS